LLNDCLVVADETGVRRPPRELLLVAAVDWTPGIPAGLALNVVDLTHSNSHSLSDHAV